MNILRKLSVDDRSDSFFLAVKHEAIVNEAADKYFTVYQFGVGNNAGSLNLVYT